MKTLNYFLLLLCLPMAVQSQTSFQYTHVQESLLLEAADVIEKNDGEFLFAHSPSSGWSQLGLGKLSSQGQWLSENIVGTGEGYSLRPFVYAPLQNGQYLLISDSTDCPWIICTSRMKLIRLSEDGDFISTDSLDMPHNSLLMDHALENDALLTILSRNTVTGSQLHGFDTEGNLLWSQNYQLPAGQGNFRLLAHTPVQAGGYMLAGYLTNGNRMVMIQTDNAGDTLWTKSTGVMWNTYRATEIVQVQDEHFYLTGDTAAYNEPTDIHLTKTDALGNIIFCKKYGGDGVDYAKSILALENNEFVILGTTYSFGAGGSDYYLIKTDAEGNLIWSKTFGTSNDETAKSIRRTADGGFIISGDRDNGIYEQNLFIVKTDAEGNLAEVVDSQIENNRYPIPNPAQDIVNFNTNERVVAVALMDATGRIVLTHQDNFGVHSVSVSSLPNGYYTYLTTLEDRSQHAGKILVQR
ncbi:MAG: T9SS type A sorting domain-containing protein [Flavobacteriales bacterium]